MPPFPKPSTIRDLLEPLRSCGVSEEAISERANQIAMALSPDYLRAESILQHAISLTAERERLVFWMGRLLATMSLNTTTLAAIDALRSMGFSQARVDEILQMGEPFPSLSDQR